MANFQNPFLRGWYGAQEGRERSTANQIGQVGGLLQIDKSMQDRNEQGLLRNAVVIGPNGQLDPTATLSNIYKVNPVLGVKFQTALQKESHFGKVDPKDYTPESISKFSTSRNYSDLVPVRKREPVNRGGTIEFVDPYQQQTPLTVGVSPNTQATLNQGQSQFNATLPIQQANAGANLTNTFYNTGMGPAAIPGLTPPPMAPQNTPLPGPSIPQASPDGMRIPPQVQAQRDAEARRIQGREVTGGGIPTASVVQGSQPPQPQNFVPQGTPLPRPPSSPRQRAEAAAKLAEAQPKAQMGTEAALGKAAIVSDKVQMALDTIENSLIPASGLIGKVASFIPGNSAYDLDKTIDTIKANVGFKELQDMRAASPTGGALGQVAVRELEFLQAAVASLEQGQSREQLESNLKQIRTHFSNWQEAMKQAYKDQFGATAPLKEPPSRRATDKPTNGGLEFNGFRFPSQDALNAYKKAIGQQ